MGIGADMVMNVAADLRRNRKNTAVRILAPARATDTVPWRQQTWRHVPSNDRKRQKEAIMANKTATTDPTQDPDELSDAELEELHDPDDDPDEADVDASKHNVNIAAAICGVVCGVLLIGAVCWLLARRREHREEHELRRDFETLKRNVKRMPELVSENDDVRRAVKTISTHMRDMRDDAQDVIEHAHDALRR